MRARPLPVLVGAAALSVALGGCHPKSLAQAKHDLVGSGVNVSTSDTLSGPVVIAERLDCPEQQGALTRTAQAADGRSCSYRSERGEVDLALVDAHGDPAAALAPTKARLDAVLPASASHAAVQVVSDKTADGREVSQVDLPFMHVEDDGRRAHVNVMGMTIDADDSDRSHLHQHRHGWVGTDVNGSVAAGPDHDEDEGEGDQASAASGPRGREFVYLLAGRGGKEPGAHAVGYVARGDAAGDRLVVASFTYRKGGAMSGDGQHDSDIDHLLDLNARRP